MTDRYRTRRTLAPLLTALAPLLAAGCVNGIGTEGEGAAPPTAAPLAAPPPVHIDSVLPIAEEIRRFRAGLPQVGALHGGADSRAALVARFLRALEQRDGAALQALALTPAEFVWLYYPHTHYTARPYELSPALVWFQLENHGGRGLQRALARHGGERLHDYACPDEPRVEGPNRIHGGCVVHRTLPGGETVAVALFGPILEHDGRFKFISLANGL